MGIKKKLGMGIATAALGLSLVGGGTYAYFSDQEVTNNTFAAGTLDLGVDPSTIINVDNLKPGDTMFRHFKLSNSGTLPIKDVAMSTSYTVDDAKGNNGGEDFGDHIIVKFLFNADRGSIPVFETSLSHLQSMTPNAIKDEIWSPIFGEHGPLQPGDSDNLYVYFEFKDNGKDQNKFQGDALNLTWNFDAHQTAGTER
ncbi:camelysin [Scopulibacillus darangshiensis]|uniref:Camelysin n=1 Tax=Scopulibacillus darangshiensis TaxID=442528 RepID=A0A4R2P5U9_9BACL|nr:CalY family protein [Scopulibacillus darangshiensis]TCP30240.1 camelysin [Scopulibacillus darangshiensis]